MTDTEELVQLLRSLARSHLGTRSARFDHAADTIERLATTPSTPVKEVCPTCKGQVMSDDRIMDICSWPGLGKLEACKLVREEMLSAMRVSTQSSKPVEEPSPTDDEQVMREILADEYSRRNLTSMASRVLDELPTDPGLDITVAGALSAMRLYASRVRAEERERCAKIAAGQKNYDDALQKSAGCSTAGERIAAAIRTGDK